MGPPGAALGGVLGGDPGVGVAGRRAALRISGGGLRLLEPVMPQVLFTALLEDGFVNVGEAWKRARLCGDRESGSVAHRGH